jgi:aspartyl-tRNA(Asn)/glutamyl-tRNA(Gln) amidotransferase subunit A
MSDPWLGDASTLVDEFRSGRRSPAEELDATLAALERSELNAFSFVAADAARAAAAAADVSLPLGGVPVGVKELTDVGGWPQTEASLVLRDRVAARDSTVVQRLRAAGAVLVGLTTASEFGGISLTYTKLNGPTRNPWDRERTPGGSSGGSAAAVAGGLVALATGGDGGGSIRIPAAFTGLPGLKTTYGRIPRGPELFVGSLTASSGCLSRSVRDIARYLDVTNGFDPRDPTSLPRVDGWETGLGAQDLRGRRAVISPDLGRAVIDAEVVAAVMDAAERLVRAAGLVRVDIPVKVPDLGLEWALAGLAEVRHDLGDAYPDCADDLTPQIAFGLRMAEQMYDLKARVRIEANRTAMNETMADLFEQVDFVITATVADVAFGKKGPFPTVFNGVEAGPGNNGALTIPSNIYGNPAISIPAGMVRGLPVGLQVLAPHHREADLLDLALVAERDLPWPATAPGAPI